MLGGSNSDLLLICVMVGGKPKDWDSKDVNNECSADNFGNNVDVETYTTHDKCTDFGKSMMEICCDVIKKYMTDLIIDNTDKAKIDAVFVDGSCLCVLIIQYRCGSNSTCMCSHLILLYSYSYVSIYVSSYLILYNYSYMCIYLLICVLFAQVPHVPPLSALFRAQHNHYTDW